MYDTVISYCQLLQLRLLTTRFILMPAIWSLSALENDLKVSSLKCYVYHVLLDGPGLIPGSARFFSSAVSRPALGVTQLFPLG
jgi:hypothetical protein